MLKYQTIFEALGQEEMSVMLYNIQNSQMYEIGDLSHVVLKKDPEKRIGYFGDDTFELCYPAKGLADDSLALHHLILTSIVTSAFNSVPLEIGCGWKVTTKSKTSAHC